MFESATKPSPLNRFRNVLAREYKWPEKTKDTYHARYEFHHTLFRDLMSAQSLVVLIDIPSMLMAGDQRFWDERQIVVDLRRAMCSDTNSARILRTLRLKSSLKRVAFVASKSDLLLEDDLRDG